MKLSAFAAIDAVIGGSFLIPFPAEARNGWIYAAKGDLNTHYVNKMGHQGPQVKFHWKATDPGGWDKVHLADYNGWKVREIKGQAVSEWHEALPRTVTEGVLLKVCR